MIPKYSEGDQVVIFQFQRSGKKVPVVVTVGEVLSWKRLCRREGKVHYQCIRKITDATGNIDQAAEENFHKISVLEEWETGWKVVQKVKNTLKKEGVIGGTIYYKGSIYLI